MFGIVYRKHSQIKKKKNATSITGEKNAFTSCQRWTCNRSMFLVGIGVLVRREAAEHKGSPGHPQSLKPTPPLPLLWGWLEIWLQRQREKSPPATCSSFRSQKVRQRVCGCAQSVPSCPILCNPMDCSPSGSPDHGILQTRILQCTVIPFSRGSSQPRDRTEVSWVFCTGRQILYH